MIGCVSRDYDRSFGWGSSGRVSSGSNVWIVVLRVVVKVVREFSSVFGYVGIWGDLVSDMSFVVFGDVVVRLRSRFVSRFGCGLGRFDVGGDGVGVVCDGESGGISDSDGFVVVNDVSRIWVVGGVSGDNSCGGYSIVVSIVCGSNLEVVCLGVVVKIDRDVVGVERLIGIGSIWIGVVVRDIGSGIGIWSIGGGWSRVDRSWGIGSRGDEVFVFKGCVVEVLGELVGVFGMIGVVGDRGSFVVGSEGVFIEGEISICGYG